MKKTIILAIMMVMVLTGCGIKEEKAEVKSEVDVMTESVIEETDELVDMVEELYASPEYWEEIENESQDGIY